MITHTGPNRYVVLAVYAVLALATLLVVGSRLVLPEPAAGPSDTRTRGADSEER